MLKKQMRRVRICLRIALFFLIIAGYPLTLFAQNPVKGTVTDEKGEPLIGVNLQVKGTTNGTITDFNGEFTMQVSPGDILSVSYIGYTPQEIKVENQTTFRIILKEDTEMLDEVVVVGYGTMKKRDITGSVKSFDNSVLMSTGQNSTLGALRGQSAGVNVTPSTGKLGAGYKIEIRGMNSIGKSSDPLVVIDGVIGGDINALNPAEGGSNHNPFTGFEKENADNRKYTDWLDYTLQKGFQTTHTIGMSGGNDQLRHIMSFGYTKQTGNIPGEQMTRFNGKLGLEGKAGNFTMGMSAYIRYSDIDNGSKEALRSSLRLRPIASPYDADGNRQFYVQDYRPERFTNPLYDAENENTNLRQMNVFANVFMDYKIIEGLNIRTSFAPSIGANRDGYSADTFTKTNKGTDLPKADLTNVNQYTYTWDNTATYMRTFKENHRLNAMVGTSTYKRSYERSYIQVKNIPFHAKWHNLGAAGEEVKRESNEEKETMVSFMARLNYSYKDKYIFTATGRGDGSSKLAEGNKWGFFPSAAVAWRITGEDFLKENEVVDDLKIRVSYGESGNNVVGPYSTILGTNNTQYDFGGVNANGQYLNRIKNDNLGWEKSKEVNLGVDFSFFNSRLSGNIELYHKDNVDIIMGQNIPQTNGFTNISAINIGKTRNRGLEIGLNTVNILTRDFTWTTNLSFATNKNEVREIFGDKQDYPDQNLFIGHPVLVHYDYEWNGIWQLHEEAEAAKYGRVPGAVKEVDQNKDGVMNPEDDRVILGNPFPDWTGSITNTFTYKNLDLSIFVYTRQGEMKWSKFHQELQNEYLGEINQLKVNYWTPENPSNEFFRPGGNGGNTNLLSYKDCSFVRVGNITLGYTFPKKVLKALHASRIRAYVTAVNPFLFTNYTGLDPEFGANSVNRPNNADADNTATYNSGVSTASYLFGLNVTF